VDGHRDERHRRNPTLRPHQVRPKRRDEAVRKEFPLRRDVDAERRVRSAAAEDAQETPGHPSVAAAESAMTELLPAAVTAELAAALAGAAPEPAAREQQTRPLVEPTAQEFR
jgi:hypothetical protein